jgi:hypothetical protein
MTDNGPGPQAQLQTQSNPTQLAVRRPPQGLMPQTFEGWKELAVFASQSGMVPKELTNNPGGCLIAMQFGSSLGLDPLQSLQSVMVVNGRPAIFGDATLAVCMAHPQWHAPSFREWFEGQGEQYTACCSVGRFGYAEPTVGRFSVADAIRAGLWGKAGPWTFYPQRMLQMRARAFALRNLYADALRGIAIVEEVQDIDPPRSVPTAAISLKETDRPPGMPFVAGGALVRPPAPPPNRADAIAQSLAAQMPKSPEQPTVAEVAVDVTPQPSQGSLPASAPSAT